MDYMRHKGWQKHMDWPLTAHKGYKQHMDSLPRTGLLCMDSHRKDLPHQQRTGSPHMDYRRHMGLPQNKGYPPNMGCMQHRDSPHTAQLHKDYIPHHKDWHHTGLPHRAPRHMDLQNTGWLHMDSRHKD
ncbi:hypothetical protein [Thalassospira lucentensis]|uniref:hypothetical protein n=1 Tax=Thalassospira lucentensis TaxID=168935 RepID=UPI00399D6BF0